MPPERLDHVSDFLPIRGRQHVSVVKRSESERHVLENLGLELLRTFLLIIKRKSALVYPVRRGR